MEKIITVLKILVHLLLALIVIVVTPMLITKFVIVPAIGYFVIMGEEPLRNLNDLSSILLTVLGYITFAHFYEKRQAIELIPIGRNMIAGAVAGGLTIGLVIIALFTSEYYRVDAYQGIDQMLYVAFGLSVLAITEEFIFRGILFRILEHYAGSYYAIIFIALLVGFLSYLPNENLAPTALVSYILMNALWCGIYILSRNLWVVGIHHAAWNYVEFASGSLDEHWRVSAPIISSYDGPAFITGGTAGPEGSLLTAVLCASCLLFLYRRATKMPRRPAARIESQAIINPPVRMSE